MDNNPVQSPGKAQACRKRSRPRKVTKKALMAAIKGSGGMEYIIASRLGGLPMRVLHGLLAIYPDAEKARRDERDNWVESIVAKAEEALLEAVNRKEPWAIEFASKRWGDYIQRAEAVAKKLGGRDKRKKAYKLIDPIPYPLEEIPEEWKRQAQEEMEEMRRNYKPDPPIDYEPDPPLDWLQEDEE